MSQIIEIFWWLLVILAGIILLASIIVNCFCDTDKIRKDFWQEIQKEREEEDDRTN